MAAISNFIPNVWAARFLSRLDDELVHGRVVNSLYEGDIAQAGDTVKIPTPTTTVSVADYTVDTDIAAASTTSGTTQDLEIDQQKYYHFYVDDIDAAQSRPNIMDDAMGRAARAMALNVDTYLAGLIHGAYDASRRAANIATLPTADEWAASFIKGIAALNRMMTAASLPQEDRWIVVDEHAIEGLEIHFASGSGSAAQVFQPRAAEETLRNGFAGTLLGFRLHVANSTRLQAGAAKTKRYYAGQGTEATTLARQIVVNEAYRPERRFGDAVKGLMVYGAKVTLPARLYSIEQQVVA